MNNNNVILSDENLNHLTHLIYETLEDHSVWEKFFNLLCESIGAFALHVVAHDKSNGALSYSAGFNMPPQGELDYLHKYQFIDPRVPALLPKPALEWIHDHEIVSEETMAVHPFYQEFMIPYGVKYFICY